MKDLLDKLIEDEIQRLEDNARRFRLQGKPEDLVYANELRRKAQELQIERERLRSNNQER